MKDERILRDRRDFQTIYNRGKSVADRYVVIFYKANPLGFTRTCFLASKKVGNAVTRNRARRLMKESYRLLPPPKEGYDIIFIARNTMPGKGLDSVKASMANAMRRAKLTVKQQ